jgi:hypothetical protein
MTKRQKQLYQVRAAVKKVKAPGGAFVPKCQLAYGS